MTCFISLADQDVDVMKFIQFFESPWLAKAKLKRKHLCMKFRLPGFALTCRAEAIQAKADGLRRGSLPFTLRSERRLVEAAGVEDSS